MTPGAREEIERLANYTAHDIWHDLTIEGTKRKIFEVILTQVEKARAEERERCALVAESFRTLTGQADNIASEIRNKLNQKGE